MDSRLSDITRGRKEVETLLFLAPDGAVSPKTNPESRAPRRFWASDSEATLEAAQPSPGPGGRCGAPGREGGQGRRRGGRSPHSGAPVRTPEEAARGAGGGSVALTLEGSLGFAVLLFRAPDRTSLTQWLCKESER